MNEKRNFLKRQTRDDVVHGCLPLTLVALPVLYLTFWAIKAAAVILANLIY